MKTISRTMLNAAVNLLAEFCDAMGGDGGEVDREELDMVLEFTEDNGALKAAVDALYRCAQVTFSTCAPTWQQLDSVVRRTAVRASEAIATTLS